jgi:uncharacterized protein (DUF58 family)
MATLAASESAAETPSTGNSHWRLTALGRIIVLETVILLSTPFWQPRPLGCVIGVALVIGLVTALIIGRRRSGHVRLTWLGPDHAIAGEDTTLSLQATCAPGCAGSILDIPSGVRGGRDIIARLGDLDATGVRIAWETRLSRRGWQRLPAIDVVSNQPFGLFNVRHTVSDQQDILVLPGRGLLTRELRRRLDPWMEQLHTGTDAGDEEVARLRPYRPGDPPRRIHWRASARQRHLVVAERHAPTARHIALVLDTDRHHISARRLDRLCTIAASFIDHLVRRGWQVSLHGRFAPSGLHGDRRLLLETLALIDVDDGDIPLETCVPQGRAAIVLSAEPFIGEGLQPQPLALTIAECESLVRLPRRLSV